MRARVCVCARVRACVLVNACVCVCVCVCDLDKINIAQSAGAAEYTDCISAECPDNNAKQSNGEAPVMLELWGVRSTPLLPSLPGPLWPRVVAPYRVLSMGQVELNCVLMLN